MITEYLTVTYALLQSQSLFYQVLQKKNDIPIYVSVPVLISGHTRVL